MRAEKEIQGLLYLLPIVILLLGGLLGLSLWVITTTSEGETAEVVEEGVIVPRGELPPLGKETAPVQIIMFGDYQCPFCARFFSETEQELRATFIRQGDAVMWWRDFAILGEDSVRAAHAARCANEQNNFWQYHDLLYSAKTRDQSVQFTEERLRIFALELGLQAEAYDSCTNSQRYMDLIRADQQEGRDKGVQGVPTLFINGKKIVGAQPFQIFESAIKEALEER